MEKYMWLPSGIVDCSNFKNSDITFDNLANLCYTQRAWSNVTSLNWSVSNHAYLSAIICAHLLRNDELNKEDKYRAIVTTLLHDSEESFITDIPTPFKSDETRKVGDNIRSMIFDFLGIEGTSNDLDADRRIRRIKSVVELADIISLFWEVKHGYKHWESAGYDCILPVLIERCRRMIYFDIRVTSIAETLKWVGIDRSIIDECTLWDELY